MAKISFGQLANRLMREKPSRELDCLIAITAGGFVELPEKFPGSGVMYGIQDAEGVLHIPGQAPDMLVPHYTTSIDAALKLVPADFDWVAGSTNGGLTDYAQVGSDVQHFADNPPMALCVGALRARSAML